MKKLLFAIFLLIFSLNTFQNAYSANQDDNSTSISDGSTTVWNPWQVTFSGGTVSNDGDGSATVTITAGSGSGDSITVNASAVDTTANFTNDGNVDFTLVDGGAGGPDVVKADFTEVDGSTTNEINTLTLPDANVTAGLGITFAQSGSIAITESVADTVLFTVTETDPLSAKKALDNLASVAINTSLLSDTADTDDLGSTAKEWLNLYIGDAGKIFLGLGQDTSINRSGANAMTITATGGVTISDGLIIDEGAISDSTIVSADIKDGTITGSDLATNIAITTTGLTTLNGNLQLGETEIKLDATLSGDETWSGITTSGTLGATIAKGDLCYLNNDDSRWELADANLSDGYDKVLGICLTAGNDGDATTMLLYGKVRSAAFPAFTVGSPLYLSETAGDLTHTAPTTTDSATRIMGIAITAEDLLFNPESSYYTHT